MKIRPVRVELFHADRRTDVTTLIVALHNFANAPKINRPISYPPNQKFKSHLGIRKRKIISVVTALK